MVQMKNLLLLFSLYYIKLNTPNFNANILNTAWMQHIHTDSGVLSTIVKRMPMSSPLLLGQTMENQWYFLSPSNKSYQMKNCSSTTVTGASCH